MPDTGYRKLQEWIRKLSPKTIFLLIFLGSAVAVGIVSWIPIPSVRTIVVGIGLCLNALLIAWFSQVQTEDNKATIRERTILLQQIKKLQRMKEELQASADTGRRNQPRERPSQPISTLEKSPPNVAGLPSRPEAGDPTTSQGWGIGEQEVQKQWKLLKSAEKAMVRFVLLKGTATATQLLQFRDSDGLRTTDTCAAVRKKTSFLLGDLASGLTINPRFKAYLEKILVEDKGRDARSF